MVKDTSSGKGSIQSLNSIVSECAWGTFNASKPLPERNEYDWNLYSDALSSKCPTSPHDQHLVTFGNYLEEFTFVPKSTQKQLKTTFTNPDNSIGSQFRPGLEELVSKLTLPPSLTDAPLPSYFSDGFYHILPSFFRLVDHLVTERVDFRIVWRSFGLDAGNIVDEFNAYCEDRHPFLRPTQRLDGTDPNYPINLLVKLPEQSGVISRVGDQEKDLIFSYVSEDKLLTTTKGAKQLYQTLLKDILRFDQPLSQLTQNHSHFRQTFVLRDDFSYWHHHQESDDSGKIMLISDESDPSLLALSGGDPLVQIFFDDNIERNFAHIVDARDWKTFAPIPYQQTKDRYLKRVEPLDLILNDNYLIELFSEHIKKYYSSNSKNPEL